MTVEFMRADERFQRDFIVSFILNDKIEVKSGFDISKSGFSFASSEPLAIHIHDDITFKITNTLIGSSHRIKTGELRNATLQASGDWVYGVLIKEIDHASNNMHALLCETEKLNSMIFNSTEEDEDERIPGVYMQKAKEAVLALNLSVGQLESSLHGTNQSAEKVSLAIVKMNQSVEDWSKIANEPDCDPQAFLDYFRSQLPGFAQYNYESTIAVQYFDRLNQRLSHISNCLLELAHIFSSKEQFVDDAKWSELMTMFKKAYVTLGDMEAFEQLIKGMSVHEAMVYLIKEQTVENHQFEVELF